ncbi:MAG: ATPase [Bacteroidales bacterium]|nr:ATPase [Bacteroidales bacterium]
MIVIADGGSTKVDWRAISENGAVKGITTPGINPVFLSEDEIYASISEKLSALPSDEVSEVWYYGAGIVSEEAGAPVCGALKRLFPAAQCHADSDLMAAARALCGNEPGIVCILGTGSNSCFYDGKSIAANVRAGGFILGDEASGAWFGKQLLSDFVKGLLPQNLSSELVRRYGLDYPTVVQKVYRDPLPSRYLASFLPFIGEYANHPYCRNLLRKGFETFLTRNVAQYDYRRYPVNFTGSVAWVFRDHLESCLKALGMRPGTIVKKPADLLAKYHKG